MIAQHSPFVLGKPIKDPDDFYGRAAELRELFESIRNMQPVALVGEHRCGNTSILYQILNDGVRSRFVPPAEDESLMYVLMSAQLAAEGTEAFYRRLALSLKRADPDAGLDVTGHIDNFWIEDYLEGLSDRDKRLVLLLDEFEVLADFPASFWEWFRGLIIEYDLSVVVATRVELGDFREEWGSGSPFFNMFRSIYVGSFSTADVDDFLAKTGAAIGIDFAPARPAIDDLAGRFPYYLQVAASLFADLAAKEPLTGSADQVAGVAHEFAGRVEVHFDDTWAKLPVAERQALQHLATGSMPEGREAVAYNQALPLLARRGYLLDGHIFSSAFKAYILRHMPRIQLSIDSGAVHIEQRPVDLPPKEFSLLRYLINREGDVVTKDEIAAAVWPEYSQDAFGVTDSMIQKTISRLRKEVDLPESDFQHIESVRGQGYRFLNASVYDILVHGNGGGSSADAIGAEA